MQVGLCSTPSGRSFGRAAADGDMKRYSTSNLESSARLALPVGYTPFASIRTSTASGKYERAIATAFGTYPVTSHAAGVGFFWLMRSSSACRRRAAPWCQRLDRAADGIACSRAAPLLLRPDRRLARYTALGRRFVLAGRQ